MESALAEIDFLVCPKKFFAKKILLYPKAILALNCAAKALREISHGGYELVLIRGYVYWGKWRRFLGQLAKLIFCLLYSFDKTAAKSIFHSICNYGFLIKLC